MSTDCTKETLKLVFENWNDEREQMFALVAAIEIQLRSDPDQESDNINAWRLAQVAMELLGDTGNFSALQRCVGVAP